ncbi:uncharacterized protein PHACADRAFT_193800 [Phanerochaete carnosa HHB-10118-sp]|uniref:ABC transporter domain-containing protein n=1 Tax=Phanerochaete carnosa (strain HHB-10118-sp) TaxID=650164 RepID=K5X731_PHACS|nr:uncharacterized protein PHACADRAFT_193800 [Phanerochaete carnosa HHB-10118-sp]EKM58682.1 hypothetical protein PHACADRAFT_193800 [Phanerochaete carnosa HHB-10118-sp]
MMLLATQGALKGTMTLSLPLNFLDTIYRETRPSSMDLEIPIQHANSESTTQGAKPLELKGGPIQLENVRFALHSDRPILSDLNFTIPAGMKVALFGSISTTRSSTACGSRARAGQLAVPLGRSAQCSVRTPGRERRGRGAARETHVHEAVMRLPEGYATKVGEHGLMISGDEKQRLVKARVLPNDPRP